MGLLCIHGVQTMFGGNARYPMFQRNLAVTLFQFRKHFCEYFLRQLFLVYTPRQIIV